MLKTLKKGIGLNLSEAVVFHVVTLIVSLVFVQPAEAQLKALPKSEKHRIIALTDIGGDLDDEQSFTRFLLYSDQYDIEGLLATSIRIFPKDNRRPIDGEPQPRYLVKWIKAYGEVRDNPLKHSEGWPEPEALLGMIRKGRKTGRDGPFNIRTGIAGESSNHFPLDQILGEGKDTEASMHIIEVVDRHDHRPVWVTVWGGPIDLAQALWRVRNDRNKEDVERFVDKLRIYAWGYQDAGGLWIQENFPDVFYIVSIGGILYSADSKLHDQEWLDTNVRFNHSPLGAMCPVRKGMLGGCLRKQPGSEKQWIDLESNLDPDSLGYTISRWAPHFQNDYQARMDWCVKELNDANQASALHSMRPAAVI